MTTASDIVTRALRLINVVAVGETPSDNHSADALDRLNDMLHGWAKEGIDFAHSTMTLSDTMRMHESYHLGIECNLAVMLSGQYGRPVPEWVAKKAVDSFAAFQAHTLEFSDDMKVDNALQPRYFNNKRSGAYDIDEG